MLTSHVVESAVGGDVEERLVQRSRLHLGVKLRKDLARLLTDGDIPLEVCSVKFDESVSPMCKTWHKPCK